MKSYIDKVAKFKGRKWAIANVEEHKIFHRGLELIVPHTGNTMQKEVLKDIVKYAKDKKVIFKIIPYA